MRDPGTRDAAKPGTDTRVTGSLVVLTTAHRDHVPEHCDPANLFAACQRCHLAYDSGHHAVTGARTRQARITAGMEPLPGPWPEPEAAGYRPARLPLSTVTAAASTILRSNGRARRVWRPDSEQRSGR